MEKSDYNNLENIANNLLTEAAKSEAERKKECEHKPGHYWCSIEKKCKIKDDGGWVRGGINEDSHDDSQIDGLRREIMSQIDKIEDVDLLHKITNYITVRRSDDHEDDRDRYDFSDDELHDDPPRETDQDRYGYPGDRGGGMFPGI